MNLFRRRGSGHDRDVMPSSYESAAANPELLAAEDSVRELPPPPPSMNPYFDVIMGSRPRMVAIPEDEEPPARA